MLDEEYKDLINSLEVTPPASAWNFIEKAISKPWYAKVWGKAAIFTSAVVVSGVAVYLAINPGKVAQQIASKQTNTTSENVQEQAQSTKQGFNQNSVDKTTSVNQNNEEKVGTPENKTPDSQAKEASSQKKQEAAQGGETNSGTVTSQKSVDAQTNSGTSNAGGQVQGNTILKVSAKDICIGKKLSITVTNALNNATLNTGDNLHYSLQAGRNIIPYAYTLPGVYNITVTQNDNVVASAEIHVDNSPKAYFKTAVAENTSIVFNNLSLSSNKFIWQLGDGKTVTTTGNEALTHDYQTTSRQLFNVQLIAINILTGCSDTFKQEVRNPNFKNYFFTAIPDVFTPNNDGLNDVFEIPATEMKEWYMVIISETGQQVYETNNQKNYWNGKVNNVGNECGKGTYRYMIRYRQPDDDEVHQKSGYITLIR